MAGEGADLLPRLGIPKAQRPVVTAGEQASAVRRKGDAPNPSLMAGEGADLLPRLGIPEAQRPVVAAGEQAAAVGRKGDARTEP
jgi:hypothetical protein